MEDLPFVDIEPQKKCYNLQARLYGICEGCGCCADDPLERCRNRIAYLERELDEWTNFDQWFDDSPELLTLQKQNVGKNIMNTRSKLRTYKNMLKKMEEKKNDI